jgi:hypothetical protein
MGQDDRFDPLSTRLDSQFTIVEENEQGAHPLRPETGHEPKHMALDPAEQLTDRAYGDSAQHFQIVPSLPRCFRFMSACISLISQIGKPDSRTQP